jgi:uncharacterized membrane protein YcaP (DUF421 family)
LATLDGHLSRSSDLEARLQQIESLDHVRLAVLETNGRISFIPS